MNIVGKIIIILVLLKYVQNNQSCSDWKEWNDFKTINFKKDVKNKKFSIFDMRNIYSADKMKDNKIKYFSIGN